LAQGKRGETIAQISDRIGRSYLQSGMWRCACSPSGAHHWLVGDKGVGKCKYCGEERQFATHMISSYVGLSDIQSEPDSSSGEAFRER
jgi:hypothetical protein